MEGLKFDFTFSSPIQTTPAAITEPTNSKPCDGPSIVTTPANVEVTTENGDDGQPASNLPFKAPSRQTHTEDTATHLSTTQESACAPGTATSQASLSVRPSRPTSRRVKTASNKPSGVVRASKKTRGPETEVITRPGPKIPMNNAREVRPIVQLIDLNYDVLAHMMSFMSGSSVAALMTTCRHVSEIAARSLCGVTVPRPFTESRKLLSFYGFLRIGSSTPRWQHVWKLDLRISDFSSQRLSVSSGDVKQDLGGEYGKSTIDVLIDVLRTCTNLQHLRINDWNIRFDIPLLFQTISKLPALKELRLSYPYAISTPETLDFRKLAKMQLQTLAIDEPGPGFHGAGVPKLVQALCPFRGSLVELCIPGFHDWVLSPDVVFHRVERLTIGYPGPTRNSLPQVLRDSFPNLQHLRMAGNARWNDLGSNKAQLENLREQHKREWRSQPDAWPALASLSCDTYTAGLYALAITSQIPRLAVLIHPYGEAICEVTEWSKAVVSDVRPSSCLELVMPVDYFASLMGRHGSMEFDIIRVAAECSPALRCCVLTIKPFVLEVHDGSVEEWLTEQRMQITFALIRALPGLSFTHILIQHRGQQLDKEKRGHYKEDLSVLQQKLMAAVYAGAYDTAQSFLCASPGTLRWIGVQAYGHPLRCWEVRSVPMPKSRSRVQTVLIELDEASGRKVVASENMGDPFSVSL